MLNRYIPLSLFVMFSISFSQNYYSLSFDGDLDYVRIPGLDMSPAALPVLTVEAWVKPISYEGINKRIWNGSLRQ